MNRFIIFCTEEQTKKALELGAPIEKIDSEVEIEDRTACISYHDGFAHHVPKITDYLYDFEGNRREEMVLIKDTEEYGDIIVLAPTPEQIIGWLEEQGFIINVSFRGTDEPNKQGIKSLYIIYLIIPNGRNSILLVTRINLAKKPLLLPLMQHWIILLKEMRKNNERGW